MCPWTRVNTNDQRTQGQYRHRSPRNQLSASDILIPIVVYYFPNCAMRGNQLLKAIDRYAGIPLLLCTPRGRRSPFDPSAPDVHRILVVKFAAIGDAVLLVPSLRALRLRYPGAEITFLGTGLTVPFLRSYSDYADQFITLDPGDLRQVGTTIRRLRSVPIDLAIDFEQWMRLSALIVRASGARHRFGFDTPGQFRGRAFTRTVTHSAAHHEAENFLSLAALAGAGGDGPRLEVRVDEAALVRAQNFLLGSGWRRDVPLVIVHPGCGVHGGPREWNPAHYARLLEQLSQGKKIFVAVTGTPQERPVMERVRQQTPFPIALYDISGLENFIALLSAASLVLSSNNGAMHLAAGLGVPQVALHGPTNAARWGPLNVRAAAVTTRCPGCPCLDLGFEYHRTDGTCMEQIPFDEVLAAAQRLLGMAS
jgi:heptosyltransferase-2